MFCRRNPKRQPGRTNSIPLKSSAILCSDSEIRLLRAFVSLCLRGKSPLFRIEQGRNVNRNHELKPPQRIDLTPCLTE